MGGGSSSSKSRPGYIYMPEEITAPAEFQMGWLGSLMGMPTGQQFVPREGSRFGGGKGGSRREYPGGRRGKGGGGGGGLYGSWEPTYTDPSDTWFNPFDIPGLTEGQQRFVDMADQYKFDDYGAGTELARTLGGEYLYGDELGLGSRMSDLSGPIFREWNQGILPGLRDEATRAGAIASSAYPDAVGRASADMGQRIAEVYAQEWGGERDRMLAAAGLAPEMDAAKIQAMQDLFGISGAPRQLEEEEMAAKWKVAEMLQSLLSSALSGPAGGSSKGWNFSLLP